MSMTTETSAPEPPELTKRESWALRTVARLSSLALQHFENLPPVEVKPDRSLVSRADREVESLARELLAELDPGCVVYGEEEGFGCAPEGFDPDHDPHWVLDPIDGTTAFLSRVPTWSVLLAYVRSGRPVVGVVALPALREIFSASSGTQATYGPLGPEVGAGVKPETACRGSGQVDWSQAYVAYSSPGQFAFRGCEALLPPLAFSCREFRTTGDAFGYTRVLIGAADVMLDLVAAPYDLAAVEVLARQTPEVVLCTATGQPSPAVYRMGGAVLAATPDLLKAYVARTQATFDSLKESSEREAGAEWAFPQEGFGADGFARLFRRMCFQRAMSREPALVPPEFVMARRHRQICWRLSVSTGADTADWTVDSSGENVRIWLFREGLFREGMWERSEETVDGPLETMERQLERILAAGPQQQQEVTGDPIAPEGHRPGRRRFVRPLFERPEQRLWQPLFPALHVRNRPLGGFLIGLREGLLTQTCNNPLFALGNGLKDETQAHHVLLEIDERHELDTVGTDVLRLDSCLSVWIPPVSGAAHPGTVLFRFDVGAELRAAHTETEPEESGARVAQVFLKAWARTKAAGTGAETERSEGESEEF